MTQITISDGTTTVIMPRTRNITDAGKTEYKEATMAGGKRVRDKIGFRPGFQFTWDYVPASTISSLITMLRSGDYFTVEYPDVDGTDQNGTFSVSYPSLKVFKFVNGVAMWHGVTLTISAQGVI